MTSAAKAEEQSQHWLLVPVWCWTWRIMLGSKFSSLKAAGFSWQEVFRQQKFDLAELADMQLKKKWTKNVLST